MPARKAPSASDSPTACVAHADASTASNTASENNSAERTVAITEEQRPQQPAPGGQHQQQRQNGNADGAPDMPGIGGRAAAGQHRNQGEKQGKAQILEQADRHGQASVRTVILRLLGELRNDDGRRGHGHRAADHHRHRGSHAEDQGQTACDETGGEEHLCAADAEHFPAHGHQTRQRELKPEREHQEYHAEIRQQLRGLAVLCQRERMRPEQHPDREISQNRRQFQLAYARDHAHRSGEQDQDLQQRIAVHRVLELAENTGSLPASI